MTGSTTPLYLMAGISLLLAAAIFGFFYAWVCSTMWGLDAADPQVAVAAMQAMNASVRNAVFAPAFFGTPVALAITALLAAAAREPRSAIAFGAAALVYGFGAFAVTLAINVPMNEALAAAGTPASTEDAQRLWLDYSPPWQFWNTMRTIASAVAVLLTGYAIAQLGPRLAVAA